MPKTIIEALDERDLLRDRISKALQSMRDCVGVKVKTENQMYNANTTADGYIDTVRAKYQSFKDLVARYHVVNQAIANANASTMVTINYGNKSETMSLAAAIALRDCIKSHNYEKSAVEIMAASYTLQLRNLTSLNDKVREDANRMTTQILGKNTKDAAAQNAEALAMSAAYYEQHCYKLVDPLDLVNSMDDMIEEEREKEAALKVAIKIANATTQIDI